MRITELFTAQSIALDEAQQDRSQIIDRLVELQATHGNIRDKEAYKKGLYEREDEGSTYVDNGITVPHKVARHMALRHKSKRKPLFSLDTLTGEPAAAL